MMDSMENSRLFMIVLIVCNVILLILVLFFSGSGRGVSEKDLVEMYNRLKVVENRMATIAFDNDRLERLALKAEALEELINNVQERESLLAVRVGDLEERQVTAAETFPTKESIKEVPKEDRKKADPTAVKKPVAEKTADKTGKRSEPLPMGPTAYYTVKKGDTLYSISRQHGLTSEELRQLNRLDSNIIMPGQKIRIQ